MAGLGFLGRIGVCTDTVCTSFSVPVKSGRLWHVAPAGAGENGPMAERIIHFEITADDPERAAAFYRETFGWSITTWDGPANYWLVSTGEGLGVDGAIMGRTFEQAVINTVQVEGSLEDAVARVRKARGAQLDEIHSIPGVGRFTTSRTPRATSSG